MNPSLPLVVRDGSRAPGYEWAQPVRVGYYLEEHDRCLCPVQRHVEQVSRCS
jgi:hypothetical protein